MENDGFTLVHSPSNGKARRYILKNSTVIIREKTKFCQVENKNVDNYSRMLLIEQNLAKIKLQFSQEYM